jgi:hypothetical protein
MIHAIIKREKICNNEVADLLKISDENILIMVTGPD